MRELGLALILALAAGAAHASVFDIYGFGARAAAMAGAHAAAAEDYSAVYYNPAALTVHGAPHVGVGLNVVVPRVGIERDAAASPDAPPDQEPGTNVGVNLGLLFPLGGRIQNRFALGVGLFLPTIQVTRINAVDPQTPHFYRYDALPDKLVLALGAAFQIHETVSVGVGYQFLGSLTGSADVHLDLLTRRFTRKTLKVDVHADSGVTAGLLVRPLPSLRLAFSFRDELQIDYDLVTRIGIEQVGEIEADVSGTSLYTPQQFTWAVAWDPHAQATLTADIVWARWSRAPDPAARIELVLDTEPLGFDEIAANSGPVNLAAVDTVDLRVGAEWRPAEGWAVRAGYGLRPTPLPAQTGYANYVDSDTHQAGLGFGYSFPDPLAMHEAPLTVDVSGQLSWLAGRRMEKADPEDAVGSYEAGGPIWHVALTMRHDFY